MAELVENFALMFAAATWLCGILEEFDVALKQLSLETAPTLSRVPYKLWHLYEIVKGPHTSELEGGVSEKLSSLLRVHFGDERAAETAIIRLGRLPPYAALASCLDPRVCIRGRKQGIPHSLRSYLRLKAAREAMHVQQQLERAGLAKPLFVEPAAGRDSDSDDAMDLVSRVGAPDTATRRWGIAGVERALENVEHRDHE